MSPKLFLQRAIEPGLSLLPGYMVSDAARVALLAIAGVETNWSKRAQVVSEGPPPAVSYWQFQSNGLAGVMTAHGSLLSAACATLDIPPAEAWQAIRYNDALACAAARLLLWSDPEALPEVGDVTACWNYYLHNWRPGKPDETRWKPVYTTACNTVATRGSES
jgi:hypothetical protein